MQGQYLIIGSATIIAMVIVIIILHFIRKFEMKYYRDRIKELDVDYIYTGHCTKEKAYKILKKELGEKIIQVKCGMKIDI